MNEGRVRCPYDFSETDAMIGLLLEYGVQTTRMTLASALLTYSGATLFSALQPWLSKRGKTRHSFVLT